MFVKACDHGQLIEVAASGRKNLQLMTRLQELASAADALGLSQSPYVDDIKPRKVCLDNSVHPQLSPFSNLQPERLKLTGKGNWDAARYLEPELYMAYQEPQFLEIERPIFSRGIPNFDVDSPATVLELFRKWDDLGLLAMHPVTSITTGTSGKVKISDRQIGDRRERNAWEARIPGPSAHLPLGTMIGRLAVPDGMGVKTCVTDRSDYYHQLAVTEERSRSNIVWPPMSLQSFLETRAYHEYVERSKRRRVVDRTVHGDQLLGHRQAELSLDPGTQVYGSFKAVLQGDHLGVEFGISSHVGFLQSHGLLREQGRLVSNALIQPAPVYEGLVIGDYFCLAPVPVHECKQLAEHSSAYQCFCTAEEKYAQAGLNGSDAKDVIDEVVATVVGAQVDSRFINVSKGILPVGAPAEKRLSLSWIAATASRYPCTTDALHSSLLGALVSAMCFRKSSMSVLDGILKVIPVNELNVEHPVLRPLKRAVAEEMILSAVLLPVLVSDIKLPFHPWIYATDASNHKGAVCRSRQKHEVVEPLWQSGDFKGACSGLETWEHQLLHEVLGERGDGVVDDKGLQDGESLRGVWEGQVQKPLALTSLRFAVAAVCCQRPCITWVTLLDL